MTLLGHGQGKFDGNGKQCTYIVQPIQLTCDQGRVGTMRTGAIVISLAGL